MAITLALLAIVAIGVISYYLSTMTDINAKKALIIFGGYIAIVVTGMHSLIVIIDIED